MIHRGIADKVGVSETFPADFIVWPVETDTFSTDPDQPTECLSAEQAKEIYNFAVQYKGKRIKMFWIDDSRNDGTNSSPVYFKALQLVEDNDNIIELYFSSGCHAYLYVTGEHIGGVYKTGGYPMEIHINTAFVATNINL